MKEAKPLTMHIPPRLVAPLVKEAKRRGSKPTKIMRYLLERAQREFLPLSDEIILP